MMKPEQAKLQFQEQLQQAGHQIGSLTPADGIEAMIAFYRDVRADGCDTEDDSDMLLYQWGTYDWGQGEFFDLDITRQLIFGGGEDENIWQLALVFKFTPTAPLRELDSGNKWCDSVEELAAFSEFIRHSNAYNVMEDALPVEMELKFNCAG